MLDSQRLFQVQSGVKDVRNGLDEVRDSIEASHRQNERRNLGLLKEKLLPETNRNPNHVLAQYSAEVEAAFANVQRLQSFNFDRLVQEESYSAWDASRASCMMLLHGRTAVTGSDYSWLSPAVFQLVAQQRARKQIVIFAFCQDHIFMEKDVPAHVILSSFISQLLEAKPSILRDEARYQHLAQRISDPAWRDTQAEVPFDVLLELLDLFSGTDVHTLLDRVDRIRGDAHGFMNSLVALIKDCKCVIKVFLVSSSNRYDRAGGKISAELQESVEDDLGSDRFWSLEWNQ